MADTKTAAPAATPVASVQAAVSSVEQAAVTGVTKADVHAGNWMQHHVKVVLALAGALALVAVVGIYFAAHH